MIEFIAAIFAWPCVLVFRLPSRPLVDYHLERGGLPLHDAVGETVKKAQVSGIWAKSVCWVIVWA